MEICLDFEASKTIDILNALTIIANKETFDRKIAEITPYSPDKNVEKFLSELMKNKKIDKEKLSFYFQYYDFDNKPFSIGECLFYDELSELACCTIENYLTKLRNLNDEQVLQKITSSLEPSEDKNNLINIDKNVLLDMLKNCNIPGEAKWNVYLIINEPKKYIKELCEFVENILPIYNKAFMPLIPLREKFHSYITYKIENEGIEYINSLPILKNIEEYKKIIVAPMIVNYCSIISDSNDDTLFVYIGMDIEKVLEALQGKNFEDSLLNLLKTIGDSSRYSILKALQKEELFGIELAEKLGLSNATISHHISFLLIANLVIVNKRDGKAYYKLNKEPLRNMISIISKEFNL